MMEDGARRAERGREAETTRILRQREEIERLGRFVEKQEADMAAARRQISELESLPRLIKQKDEDLHDRAARLGACEADNAQLAQLVQEQARRISELAAGYNALLHSSVRSPLRAATGGAAGVAGGGAGHAPRFF